jgi:hypothetical protein
VQLDAGAVYELNACRLQRRPYNLKAGWLERCLFILEISDGYVADASGFGKLALRPILQGSRRSAL